MLNANEHRDLDKTWRQLVRWLVADVPSQVELTAEPDPEAATDSVKIQVRARDPKFQPLDDAAVTVEIIENPKSEFRNPKEIRSPNSEAGKAAPARDVTPGPLKLRAEPSLQEAGLYEVTYVPHEAGGYLARAFVTNSVGLEVGRAEAGWATDPAAEEFRSLQPNRGLLEDVAKRTGGEVVAAENLETFAKRLPLRRAPVMEAWTTPVWHTPAVFAFALACFVGEWGLRRWKGMA